MEQHESPADFGKGPQAEVRRWLMELSLAEKRDKDWRDLGKKIWDIYRGKGRRKNSFNILWSNTETLAPAIFNSAPQPNVRRRFKDADPVGKVVSTVLERCLEFQTDTEQFMSNMGLDVLDMLLPGRGVSRIRYVPSLVQVGGPRVSRPKTPTKRSCRATTTSWLGSRSASSMSSGMISGMARARHGLRCSGWPFAID
jgi:hypothetical protein